MRKIPMKNYVVFGMLVIVTLAIVYGVRKIYLDKIEYEKSTNETLNILSSVNEDELATYLVENRDIILYMSSSGDDSIKSFENELRKYVLNHQLSQDIIYLNTRNVSDAFFTNFKDKYFASNLKESDIEVVKQPNMFLVENGKIVSVMYNSKHSISIDDVKKFIGAQEV